MIGFNYNFLNSDEGGMISVYRDMYGNHIDTIYITSKNFELMESIYHYIKTFENKIKFLEYHDFSKIIADLQRIYKKEYFEAYINLDKQTSYRNTDLLDDEIIVELFYTFFRSFNLKDLIEENVIEIRNFLKLVKKYTTRKTYLDVLNNEIDIVNMAIRNKELIAKIECKVSCPGTKGKFCYNKDIIYDLFREGYLKIMEMPIGEKYYSMGELEFLNDKLNQIEK